MEQAKDRQICSLLFFFWDTVECEHEKRGHARGASCEATRNEDGPQPLLQFSHLIA